MALLAASLACEPRGHQEAEAPAAAPDSVAEPPPEGPVRGETRLRTVYVPAYSHLPKGGRGGPAPLLSVLLSVRNVDTTAVVSLTLVDYFDTSGHRVRRYLEKPRTLRPLETAEFSVDLSDEAGGSGANFLVYWEGAADAHPLLTEAVMVGQVGNGHVAFTSRGIELNRRPDPARFSPTSAPGAVPVEQAP